MRIPTTRPSGGRTVLASAIAVLGAASAGYLLVGRRRQLHWGTSAGEPEDPLPGDELVPRPDLTATRAITIAAGPDRVWPWIVQLGQGRGGFYSYDVLENLLGCDIHSADRIVSEWQWTTVGDEVRLAPTFGLKVAILQPGRALVLRGGVPIGRGTPPFDFTWAFTLRALSDGTTRLVVRERYAYARWWAPCMVEPVEVVSFLMHRRMLRGIRDRAAGSRSSRSGRRGEPDYDRTVVVRRPPEALYAILADQQDYGDHSPGSLVPVLEKIPDTPTTAGTRWHEVVRLAPFLTMTVWSTVTTADPPNRLAMRWTGPWMHGELAYGFEACPEGTRFRQQETFVAEGPLRPLGGLLRRSLFRRVASRQLDIRDLAERGETAGPGRQPS